MIDAAPETDFEDAIIALATATGWHIHAERPAKGRPDPTTGRTRAPTAIKGHIGYPDLTAAHPTHSDQRAHRLPRPHSRPPNPRHHPRRTQISHRTPHRRTTKLARHPRPPRPPRLPNPHRSLATRRLASNRNRLPPRPPRLPSPPPQTLNPACRTRYYSPNP